MQQLLKNKVVLLFPLLLVTLLLCYKLAISNTLALKKEYRSLKAEEQLFNDIPQQLMFLSKKEKYLDSLLQKLNLNNTSLENNLLRVVNSEAAKNNLKVMDFNPPHKVITDNNSVTTYEFVLRGGFTGILKTIYTIENQSTFGEVIHLNFSKDKNYRTNKNHLEVKVLMQHIE
ncbi:hypothetical protein KIM67_03325 [Flagellimonas sp. 389]|uniref:hypothetical protein n=1 Tax=Flagellimonas sp. 389 TaxID=2835862 RepID=UPI001BD1EE86|nr:hypothetical protein [Flagellimonas sp. 389]MBS9461427.1 hypothetical protein [Flagellimonas sp. 389]